MMLAHEVDMQRLRLKADGRIVELRDGQEFPLAPEMPGLAPAMPGLALAMPEPVPALASPSISPDMPDATPGETGTLPAVRDLRRRAQLTQIEFAARLGVPVETIRNWEQGKRVPRGPARALLAVIAHSPETVFAALATEPEPA
jgi:putative transcriptional regulator